MFNSAFFHSPSVTRPKFLIILLLTCAMLVTKPVQAQFYSDDSEHNQELDQHAKEAMQNGNYAIAFCIWQPLAQAGDREAQFNIGWMYHNGYGLRIDDESALFWWLKAAASGLADAHFALGDLYAYGQGVEKNTAIALGWYISAALKGHPQAQETLIDNLKKDGRLNASIFKLLLKTNWSILGDTRQVSVDKANVRRGPNKSYKVITTLEKDHPVIPLKQKDGWTYIGITSSGKTGWIFSRLISRPAGIYPVE